VTFKEIKSLTSALLIGDNVLTKKDEEVIVLLKYAYNRVANEADALKLFTTNSNEDRIIRSGPGNLFVRMPEMPTQDEDELDIDEELAFAAARYMASFVSRERPGMHLAEAQRIINSYNQKVQVFFENLSADGLLDIYEETDMFGKKSIQGDYDV
jgi:hypothetical protein